MPKLVSDATVRLYYLGGLGSPRRPQGTPVRVTSMQKVFSLPEPGDYIEVQNHIAEDLMRRHKYLTSDGELSAFTKDKRVADRVKAGETAVQAYQARTVLDITGLSNEALLNELRSRGMTLEDADPKEDKKPEKPAARVKKKGAKPEEDAALIEEMKSDEIEGDDNEIEAPI